MKFLKIGALALSGMFLTSAASAATITAMDSLDLSSDEVMFSVDTEGRSIDKITLDVSEGRGGSRFILDEDAVASFVDQVPNASIMANDFIRARGRNGYETLMVTFDGGFNGVLSFLTWLNGVTASDDRVGLIRTDAAASNIFATVLFTDGDSSTSNFSALGEVGKFATEGLAPVPLPASSLLLLGGIAGLGAMRRRKKA